MARNSSFAAIVEDSARAVAELMANAKAITDTETVILGGSVGLNDTYRALVEKSLAGVPSVYEFSLTRPRLLKNAELVGAANYFPAPESS